MNSVNESSFKVQAVIDLFKEYFPFSINNKDLETLIFNGGMAGDVSTTRLALSVAKTGSAGTIATTLSRYKEKIADLDIRSLDGIIGINNLVAAIDYEDNYVLGESIGADFIASGAGTSKEIVSRIKNQKEKVDVPYHFWTMSKVANIKQAQGLIKRGVGKLILENTEAGGHTSEGEGFEKTIVEYRESQIDKGGNKIIFAGRIRKPSDIVMVVDSGFDAVKLGTPLLHSDEANIGDEFRRLLLYSKKGSVGRVISPAGLPANGFLDEGLMGDVLRGVSFDKYGCQSDPLRGCLKDCTRISDSAAQVGVDVFGDYCIRDGLWNVNPDKAFKNRGIGKLYFCGIGPDEFFLRDEMLERGVLSLPAEEIIFRFLEGFYDSLVNREGLIDDGLGKLGDEHIAYVETRFDHYHKQENPVLDAKIFRE
ncbi:hypothetical protein GOV05_01490 [Candidatus Woesearchaeota archaeon]|nr:hypothetical protein [Candidatus Woesearchaeota archaeon]